MKKRALALAGILVVSAGTSATALSRRILVEKDKPVAAGNFSSVRRDCFTKPAQVQVLEAPKHGSLVFKEADATVGPGIGIIDRCIGRTSRATVGTYHPAKGYTGSDSYRIRASYVSDSLEYEVNVTVREPQAKKDPSADGWAAPR
jgi:hypothetical protein